MSVVAPEPMAHVPVVCGPESMEEDVEEGEEEYDVCTEEDDEEEDEFAAMMAANLGVTFEEYEELQRLLESGDDEALFAGLLQAACVDIDRVSEMEQVLSAYGLL
ncbi:hypothetical protein BDB00DRAFT_514274 [Zychaea mexicana]|uniref:uncharacterized protein n=1 Tax=Zychaea mexicana TaxID=64656 RepID=UPI0022FDCACE|nr:uncharacterized protein BDB00DRAFT_514274 [Zychaea mexicana]KAI9491122.1 hypothetical protein BDB00DRAFT_514274 [Zychaea mexicana]